VLFLCTYVILATAVASELTAAATAAASYASLPVGRLGVCADAAFAGRATLVIQGGRTCALSMTGRVSCFDSNVDYGWESILPVSITAGSYVALSSGGSICALSTEGTVSCWYSLDMSSYWNGNPPGSPPTAFIAAEGQVAIAGGGGHTCALSMAGSVSCWGSNEYGQSSVPAAAAAGGQVAVAAGGGHTCALSTLGAVLCWGRNNFGQLTVPAAAAAGGDLGQVAVVAGRDHTCALSAVGAVLCWGSNEHGQAVPTTIMADVQVAVVIDPTSIYTCAWSTAMVTCWPMMYSWSPGSYSQYPSLMAPPCRPAALVAVTGTATMTATNSATAAQSRPKQLAPPPTAWRPSFALCRAQTWWARSWAQHVRRVYRLLSPLRPRAVRHAALHPCAMATRLTLAPCRST
jgi:hypothetical protein